MWVYVKSHPPEASAKGVLWLGRGLRLGTASSIAVLLLYIATLFFPPVNPSLFWPLAMCAFAGNILNLISLASCLREINGESLFAGVLVLLVQFLWILYAIRVMSVDF
jgi:hypothetical protein